MYPAQRRPGQVLSFPGMSQNQMMDPNQPFNIGQGVADVPPPNQSFDIPTDPAVMRGQEPTPPPPVQTDPNQQFRQQFNTRIPSGPDPSQPISAGGIQIPKPGGMDTTLHRYSATPMQGVPIPAPDSNGGPTGDPDIDRILAMYSPEHEGIDMSTDLMHKVPLHSDYHPSMMRKIFGGIAAGFGGGVPAWEYITEGPYRDAVEDWARQFGATSKVADQERQANALDRQLVSSVLGDRASANRLAETVRHNQTTEETGKTNAAANMTRAQVADYRAKHPNASIKMTADGKYISIQDGQAEYVQSPDGNPISGKLSPEEQQIYKVDLIDAQTEADLTKEADRQKNRLALEAERQKNRSALIGERATARAKAVAQDKALSVGQDAAAWKLAKQQYIADNPSHLHFWDQQGEPTADAADDDTGTYETAMNDIRDRYNRIKSKATPKKGGQTPSTDLRIKMKKPNGDIVMVAAKDVERAKAAPNNYVEVP